jgi:hypothetical protein
MKNKIHVPYGFRSNLKSQKDNSSRIRISGSGIKFIPDPNFECDIKFIPDPGAKKNRISDPGSATLCQLNTV